MIPEVLATLAWAALLVEAPVEPRNAYLEWVLLLFAFFAQRWIFGTAHLADDQAIEEGREKDAPIYFGGDWFETAGAARAENETLSDVLSDHNRLLVRASLAGIALIFFFGVWVLGLRVHFFMLAFGAISLLVVSAFSLNQILVPLFFSSVLVAFSVVSGIHGPIWMVAVYCLLLCAALVFYRMGHSELLWTTDRGPRHAPQIRSKGIREALFNGAMFVVILAGVNHVLPDPAPVKAKPSRSSRPSRPTTVRGAPARGSTAPDPLDLAENSGALQITDSVGTGPDGAGNDPEARQNSGSSTESLGQSSGETSTATLPGASPGTTPKTTNDPTMIPKQGQGASPGAQVAKAPIDPLLPRLELLWRPLKAVLIGFLLLFILAKLLVRPKAGSQIQGRTAPSKEDRRRLLAELKAISGRKLSVEEEVRARYQVFLKLMKLANLPKENYLPATDYAQRLGFIVPEFAADSKMITDVFCEVHYGGIIPGTARLEGFRKAMASTFERVAP